MASLIFFGLSAVSAVVVLTSVNTFCSFVSSQVMWTRKSDGHAVFLLLVDIILVLLFIVQHHVMAASFYKQWIRSCWCAPIERSLYNLTTAITLLLLVWYWQPVPDYCFWLFETFHGGLLWLFFFLLHSLCWVVMFFQFMAFHPLEMMGLEQVWYYAKGWHYPLFYKTKYLQRLYKHMRHPGITCFLLILWLHPIMTLDRFVMSLGLTLYLLCGQSVTEDDYIYVQESVDSGQFLTQWNTVEVVEWKVQG